MDEPITKKERRVKRHNEEFGPESDAHRLLPQSQDAELGLLGSILLSPTEVMEMALEKGITPAHFHVPAHVTLFELISEMHHAQQPIDFILLTQLLRDRELLERVGGPAFVTGLFTWVPTAANAEYYVGILQEKFTAREIIRVANVAASRAYDSSEDPFALLEDVQSQIIEIGQLRTTEDTLRPIKAGILEAIDFIQNQYEARGTVLGLASGFHDFDRMTGGFLPGQEIIIAARPAMGKSAVAMNIAENVVMESKVPVAVFSLEMTYAQLTRRLLCSRAPLNMQRVRDGFLADRDFSRITTAASELGTAPMYVDDKVSTIFEFRARARRAVLKYGVKLIVVDYLQLLKSTSKRAQSDRQLEITEISGAIRETAKELDVPIVAVAQLSRDVDQRKGHRPLLSDLRESGTLEQDAHIVAFMLRPAYYEKNKEDSDPMEDGEEATLIVAKQRDGPVGDVNLKFQKEFARFRNITNKMYSNNEQERQQR